MVARWEPLRGRGLPAYFRTLACAQTEPASVGPKAIVISTDVDKGAAPPNLLVQAELVRVDQERASGAGFDRTYRLTCLGRSVLDDWMASDPEVYPRRDVFLLRLSLAADLGSEVARAMLAEQITTVGERLAVLRKVGNEQALADDGIRDLGRGPGNGGQRSRDRRGRGGARLGDPLAGQDARAAGQ